MRTKGCTKCVISSIVICTSVFTVGVILLVMGFIKYNSEPPPPPYMWSVDLCSTGKFNWVSDDNTNEVCRPMVEQTFQVSYQILGESIPYEPVVYVTDKVEGEIRISHIVSGRMIYSVGGTLSSMEKEPYAIGGGQLVNVYRNGSLDQTEGDYITETCTNLETGCKYEPARSLHEYHLSSQTVHMEEIPGDGSEITVQLKLWTNSTRITFPDVFIEYRVAGRGPVQDTGLILLIIGGLMADTMPAALFFLLQRYYYRQPQPANEDMAALAIINLIAQSYSQGVPVYVMMPLNTLNNNNEITDYQQTYQQLSYLKQNSQVAGIMMDVWWGLIEQTPQQYNWTGYQSLFQMVSQIGLDIKVTLSFHQCGGNVGDQCDIPLPPWVINYGQSNPDIFYTDQSGNRDQEYLSSGIDNEALFGGRTGIQLYSDFMTSFREQFNSMIPSVIKEIQVGLGPAGEMRYPSYQLAYWTFPGVGEFQCYDKYLLAQLAEAATASGNSDWGYAGPNNAGTYNSYPSQTQFFTSGGYNNYESQYGQFFLTWYANTLITHGDQILGNASYIFGGSGVALAAKVSGIHWWYGDPSHAAELTAGYKNDQGQAYNVISDMFKKHNVSFDFTCLEMTDDEQPSYCECRPQELVAQTKQSAQQAGIGYSGENALPRYDQGAYSEIETESTLYFLIDGFSYLRLSSDLLSSSNFPLFQQFVSTMKSLSG
ncbi:hypothetical protein DFA_03928 [Cavenderia fasciculata]|uniref:Beta-amylase n=1 Tax=Cavenderia fasciculata TaxID=261658 RepID=F4Q0T3_CACFS|nr:uncharacterized protein DFA_03928 [Cavenderia fasciculata]EGG18434.1 hypothetical protein DFA_03928 [Cavenderia fasciculata]|eukprot:XP_004366338.1 hypothetical protein DFA_03928 [Cavenderia fasciculata]